MVFRLQGGGASGGGWAVGNVPFANYSTRSSMRVLSRSKFINVVEASICGLVPSETVQIVESGLSSISDYGSMGFV